MADVALLASSLQRYTSGPQETKRHGHESGHVPSPWRQVAPHCSWGGGGGTGVAGGGGGTRPPLQRYTSGPQET